MDAYQDLNILFSSHYSDEYIRVPEFSTRQVNCGPLCRDRHDGHRQLSFQTPSGEYDIRSVIEKLPNNQKPELIVVKADATKGNHPLNIDSLSIPSLLIIGDTMHQRQPLQTMLTYASEQKFDYYIADHGKRHLHFFHQIGINAHWLPGLLIRTWDIPFQEQREIPLSFVGQAGRFHPNRRFLLDCLNRDNFSLLETQSSQEQACIIYAKSKITLNPSMMGDINLRVFEALSAGGFLITDDISPQAGKNQIFRDGDHLVLFEDYEDLKCKIKYYLDNPSEALKIAQQGYSEFWANHSPEVKKKQLMKLVFEGEIPPLYDGRCDRRSTVFPIETKDSLFKRIQKYEYLQSIHRVKENLRILFLTVSNQYLLSDLVDLPRLDVSYSSLLSKDLRIAHVSDQTTAFVIEKENNDFLFDIAVVGWDTFQCEISTDYIKRSKIEQIILSNEKKLNDLSQVDHLECQIQNLGYTPLQHDGFTAYHLNITS
ncbi:MAG: hypothetical protein CMJ80_07345 [Planctomycetaceae bacterium]|nr:hypothetical protein [Planctomycetaceae bacterium]